MPLRRKVLTIVALVALACLPPFVAGLVLNERLDIQRSDTQEIIEAIDDLSAVRATLQEAEGAHQFYGISGFTDAGQFEAYRAEADALPSRLDDLQAGLPAGLRSDELLDIKAIEAGQLAITPEELALRPVADEAISLVSTMPASRSITVTADCPDDLVAVADPRRIREVLLNLLSNAVKYNRQDGRVDLVARQVGDRVKVEVRDTGPGIAPEDQQRLFRPFERLGAQDTDVEGSGVGLAVTKRVVEVMGGSIGLTSTPGRGSTFWIDLPAGVGDDPAVTRPSERRDGRSDGAPVGAPRSGSPGWR